MIGVVHQSAIIEIKIVIFDVYSKNKMDFSLITISYPR